MATCRTCNGFKTITCPVCSGQGKVNNKPCHNCGGNRKVACPTCHGTGKQ